MHRRFAVVLLAALAVAAVFVLPAQASAKATHIASKSSVRVLRAPHSGLQAKPGGFRIAWTATAVMPVGTAETGGGVAVASKFYVPGGFNASGTPVNNLQIYNKAGNTWSQGATLPGAGGGWVDGAVCVNPADKTIHVVNGSDGSFLYAAHQVYDIVANTWSFKSFPVLSNGTQYASQDSGCAFIGGKMYLFGGYGVLTGGAAGVQTLTWAYDPATDTWIDTTKAMITGRIWQGYTSNATTAYAAGGFPTVPATTPTNKAERFTPAGGWVAQPNIPVALGGPGEAIVSNHLIVFGGDNGTVMSNKTYGCNLPACPSWATTAFNLPVARGYFSWGSGTSAFGAGGFNSSFAVQNTGEHLP
jgi:Kelch motif protein